MIVPGMANAARKIIDLEDIRADGWFEQLGSEMPNFDELCQVVGRRFLAFSFVAGVRISSIALDAQNPHASLVDFSIGGSDELQRLNLGDLREQLGAALLASEGPHTELTADPSADEVRSFIGRRTLLLAPIFGIGLSALELGGGEPMFRLEFGSADDSMSASDLRDAIQNGIRSEVARARPNQAFSIDFKKVPTAEAANQAGNFDETVSLLGSWPGPLSMFLRSAQGQSLGDGERGKLMRALCALGEAYLGRGQNDWAEDVLRLGIQFGQELDASGPLFAMLGRARLAGGRPGEAIGLFRRALVLGADKRDVLPVLARCFLERQRYVAASVCLQDARSAGADEKQLRELDERVAKALEPNLSRLRAQLGDKQA